MFVFRLYFLWAFLPMLRFVLFVVCVLFYKVFLNVLSHIMARYRLHSGIWVVSISHFNFVYKFTCRNFKYRIISTCQTLHDYSIFLKQLFSCQFTQFLQIFFLPNFAGLKLVPFCFVYKSNYFSLLCIEFTEK